MSIENLNNATAAQNALTSRVNEFLDDADAQIQERRDAYDDLANDLNSLFWRWVFIDQNNGDDTNDGSFNSPMKTIQEAAKILPNGTTSVFRFIGDYRLTEREFMQRGYYVFTSADEANPSTLSFAPQIDGVSDLAPAIWMAEALGEIAFQNINIHFESVSAHITQPWTISSKGATAVYFNGCTITADVGMNRYLFENNGVAVLSVKGTTYPTDMDGRWMVGIASGTDSNTVPRLLTTLATL